MYQLGRDQRTEETPSGRHVENSIRNCLTQTNGERYDSMFHAYEIHEYQPSKFLRRTACRSCRGGGVHRRGRKGRRGAAWRRHSGGQGAIHAGGRGKEAAFKLAANPADAARSPVRFME